MAAISWLRLGPAASVTAAGDVLGGGTGASAGPPAGAAALAYLAPPPARAASVFSFERFATAAARCLARRVSRLVCCCEAEAAAPLAVDGVDPSEVSPSSAAVSVGGFGTSTTDGIAEAADAAEAADSVRASRASLRVNPAPCLSMSPG
jgi:hypothetical protein